MALAAEVRKRGGKDCSGLRQKREWNTVQCIPTVPPPPPLPGMQARTRSGRRGKQRSLMLTPASE